ncbi:MAG: ABC transporter permease [Alphaproteobacteria bacterium]|nr:MAG: ABC transporter permease [Alphaproteobacteria bacterium]
MFLSFVGYVFHTAFRLLLRREKFYTRTFFYQIYLVGIQAIPVVALLNFLVGMVTINQGITTLSDYGLSDRAPDALIPSYIRYFGGMITYLVISGRSGSAFAAEIGAMKLSLEVDALESMKINPTSAIIIPRILALICFMPILVIVAIFFGILGGGLMTKLQIDFSFIKYLQSVYDLLNFRVLSATLLKSLVFGTIIGFIGCFRGMCVHTHFKILGNMTTKAVVQCIFWTIVFDGMMSIYITFLGI